MLTWQTSLEWYSHSSCLATCSDLFKEVKEDKTVNRVSAPSSTPSSTYNLSVSDLASGCFSQVDERILSNAFCF